MNANRQRLTDLHRRGSGHILSRPSYLRFDSPVPRLFPWMRTAVHGSPLAASRLRDGRGAAAIDTLAVARGHILPGEPVRRVPCRATPGRPDRFRLDLFQSVQGGGRKSDRPPPVRRRGSDTSVVFGTARAACPSEIYSSIGVHPC